MADAAMVPTGAPKRVRLSLVVITKNEERNIEACLESVRLADEVVVINAESHDRTVEIAGRYTEKQMECLVTISPRQVIQAVKTRLAVRQA